MALWLAKPYLPRPGRQEAFLAPAGDQERVRSAKRGNASCQGKPTGPQWRPVRDAMLFRNDLEELLMAPHARRRNGTRYILRKGQERLLAVPTSNLAGPGQTDVAQAKT